MEMENEVKLEDLKIEHQVFVTEYLKDFNGTRSYKVAYPGTSDTTACSNGSKLLRNIKIAKYLEQEKKRYQEEAICSREELLRYFSRVVRDQETEEVLMAEGRGSGVSEIVSKTKRVSTKDRNKAAELLGKSFGIFIDKTENKTSATLKVKDSWFEPDEDTQD